VILGFPSESQEQFMELVDFVKQMRFDALGCFTFWPEEGTEAAQLPGRISQEVKENRREQLMLVQQQIAFEKNKSRQGQIIECLIDENRSDEPAVGRFYGQAPYIDSVCLVDNCTDPPGSFVKTRVAGFKDYDLLVKRI
jgi:ribosomal protein S12 methylthiotransferase